MRKGFAQLHGTTKSVDNLMSAEDAFKCNNPNGYLEKQSFIEFVRRLRVEDYDHLDTFFRCLYERLRNTNSLRIRKDRGDQLYYWVDFSRANGNEGVKVIAHPGIVDMLLAYRDGKFKPDFMLDDLISEALQDDSALD